MAADANELTGKKSDTELGITDIRQRPDGIVVVKVDQKQAQENRDEYLKRIDELIDQNTTSAADIPTSIFPKGMVVTVDMTRDLLKEVVRAQLDHPDSSATRAGSIRFITMDQNNTLTNFFNNSATSGEGFGQAIVNSLPDGAHIRAAKWIEQHETGHTQGKTLGLADPGADYYASVLSMRNDPDAREELQTISDFRVYRVINPDLDKDFKQRDTEHGFGTYFAIGEALKLSPEEIKNMDEDEIVERAAKYDSLAENRYAAEYDVKTDIIREMERMQRETGQRPTLKQATDSLIRRDIYATDGRIVGDSDAIKYRTLNEFSQALDRLEKKGITSPFEEKFARQVQNQPQTAPQMQDGPGM